MKQFIRKFKQISILILAIAFVGCEEDDAILPSVEAGFTYTINTATGTVTFINISENAQRYEWDFGDETSSKEINPIKTFGSGTYTVTLKSKNLSGAYDIFEDTIIISIAEALGFPITFDNENVDYGAGVFNGAAFAIVDNPDLSGSNTSTSKVGEITNSGASYEGVVFELGAPLDLSSGKTVKMNFWSDKPVDVLLKLEITENDFAEVVASHGGTGWEELVFNFSSSETYPKVVIFVDGPGQTAGKFYIDDIIQEVSAAPVCDSETMQSLNASDFYLAFMADPSASITEDNTTFEFVDNPDATTDANKSCKVGKITNSNQNPWDNMQIDLAEKLTFADGDSFTMKVYSPQSGYKVTLKIEKQGSPNEFKQVPSTASTTKINEWEELTFPFNSADSGKYDKIVVFFDLETQNGNTYYFDDLKLNTSSGGGGGTGGGSFDSGLLTNGDFENGANAWIGNASNVMIEGGNSFNFANVMAAGDAFAVNLSQVVEIIQGKNYTLTFDASSDRNRTIIAGIGLNESPWTSDTSASINDPVNLTTTTQSFSYNFTASFGIANSRVLFDMGAEVGVVVIDNVSLTCSDCDSGSGGGTGGGGGVGPDGEFTSNGNFESGTADGYTVFDGQGGAFTVTNEEANGGSFSGKLTSGEGTEVVVKQANIGIGTVTPNTEVTITFDLKGSLAGAGGVVFVEFFSELSTEGVSKAEILSGGPLVPTDTWESYSFTTTTGPDVSGGVTVQLKTACGAVAGCDVVAYFDNVSVKFKN